MTFIAAASLKFINIPHTPAQLTVPAARPSALAIYLTMCQAERRHLPAAPRTKRDLPDESDLVPNAKRFKMTETVEVNRDHDTQSLLAGIVV